MIIKTFRDISNCNRTLDCKTDYSQILHKYESFVERAKHQIMLLFLRTGSNNGAEEKKNKTLNG